MKTLIYYRVGNERHQIVANETLETIVASVQVAGDRERWIGFEGEHGRKHALLAESIVHFHAI